MRKCGILFLASLLLNSTPAFAVPLISNLSDWDGSETIGQFSAGGLTQVYGQEFTPSGPETVLNDFSFRLTGAASITFRAYVQEFNSAGDNTLGNILFTSGPITSLAGPAFNIINVATGGLALSAGTNYVAYLSTHDIAQAPASVFMAIISAPPVNPNLGEFRFSNGGGLNPVTGPTNNPWGTFGDFGQVVFEANFSAPVPELDTQAALLPFLAMSLFLGTISNRRRLIPSLRNNDRDS